MPGIGRFSDGQANDQRGQTALDFVIGIGVFLITVAFVFGFVPGMIDPFTQDHSRQVVADRAADAVLDDLSAAGVDPGTLDTACTVSMFTRTGGTDCPFDVAEPVTRQVGVDDRYGLNATLGPATDASGSTVFCTDGTDIRPCGVGDTPLVVGDGPPTDRGTVVTASRTVVVDGRTAVLSVRTWS